MRPRRNRPINADVPRPQKQRGQQKEPRPPRGPSRKDGKGRALGRGSGEREYLKPLTDEGVRKETRANTNLKFRPLEKAIGGDIRASQRRTKETGDWWQNYLNEVNQGRSEVQGAYGQAGQEIQGQIGAASAADSANTQALNAEAAKSAELRGAPMDNSGAQREAAASAQRNYLGAAFGGATAREGANQFGYLTDQRRIGVGQSIASRKEEQRRERSLRKDRRDVRRERGDYATAKRGELRAGERDYLIQRKAFGLEKKEAAQSAKESAREAREKALDRGYERSQDAIGNRQAQERIGVSREGNKPGKGGRSTSEVNDAREGQRNANSTAARLIKSFGTPKTPKEWADLEEAVAKESEVSASEARKAVAQLKARAGSRSKGKAKKPSIVGTVIPGSQITE